MDVLTNVLSEMYLSGEVVSRFELTAPWGITMPPVDGIFHAVDRGHCWLRTEGDDELVHVAAGDLIIFPRGAAHDIVDAPTSLAMPLEEVLCEKGPDSFITRHGGEGQPTTFVCGVFHFRDDGFEAFRSLLPPVLHVRSDAGVASQWLQTTLTFLSLEASTASPGTDAVLSRLTDILFIQGVRAWLDSQADTAKGWFGALKDPVVGEALAQIHRAPERQWTVASLAAEVGLSRSAFAVRFTNLVGEPPLEYVTRWRMQLAGKWLRGSDTILSGIAERLGYSSEDTFKRAFKREVGVAPGYYRRKSRSGVPVA